MQDLTVDKLISPREKEIADLQLKIQLLEFENTEHNRLKEQNIREIERTRCELENIRAGLVLP